MTNRNYAAQWGKTLLRWHYTVGNLPYLKTGKCWTKKTAEKNAKRFMNYD